MINFDYNELLEQYNKIITNNIIDKEKNEDINIHLKGQNVVELDAMLDLKNTLIYHQNKSHLVLHRMQRLTISKYKDEIRQVYKEVKGIGLNIIGVSGILKRRPEATSDIEEFTYNEALNEGKMQCHFNFIVTFSKTDKETFINKNIDRIEYALKKYIPGVDIEMFRENSYKRLTSLKEEDSLDGTHIIINYDNEKKNFEYGLLYLLFKQEIRMTARGNQEVSVDISQNLTPNHGTTIKKESIEDFIIYHDNIIYCKDGGKKRLVGKQNRLCKYLFEENKIKNISGYDVEKYVYSKEIDKKSTLKSLVAALNKQFKSIGYQNNILSYIEERVEINNY